MADFTDNKSYQTGQYPIHIEESSGIFRRCEPLLTGVLLISRYLKGINLTYRDGSELDSEDLKDRINLAANDLEAMIGVTITREKFKQKFPYDRSLYKHYMHFKTEHRPVVSIESMRIVSANGENIFDLPIEWIEAARFAYGQINVIPLLASYIGGSSSATSATAGIALLSILESSYHFVPSFWEVKYSSGLTNKSGQVPVIINQLIGMNAAIDILSEKAADDASTSQQISQDGISQMTSSPGAAKYAARISTLEEKRDKLIEKVKGIFSNKYFIGNI